MMLLWWYTSVGCTTEGSTLGQIKQQIELVREMTAWQVTRMLLAPRVLWNRRRSGKTNHALVFLDSEQKPLSTHTGCWEDSCRNRKVTYLGYSSFMLLLSRAVQGLISVYKCPAPDCSSMFVNELVLVGKKRNWKALMAVSGCINDPHINCELKYIYFNLYSETSNVHENVWPLLPLQYSVRPAEGAGGWSISTQEWYHFGSLLHLKYWWLTNQQL